MIRIAEKIEVMLKSRDFAKVIELMREWLCDCKAGDPARLLDVCTPKWRPNVAVLLRDLLTNYPKTLLGCPLLLYATEDQDQVKGARGLGLPFPRPENACPCDGLWFVGWVPSELQPPLRLPVSPDARHTTLTWNRATAYVALFSGSAEALDSDQLQIPAEWWGDLFMKGMSVQPSGNVRIEGNLLLSYPDALEIAVAQQAGASGEPMPANGHFQQNLGWAHNVGIRFREDCRAQFLGSDI